MLHDSKWALKPDTLMPVSDNMWEIKLVTNILFY